MTEAAGRYGDLRIRSKLNRRALCSRHSPGFPDPDLFKHFAHSGRRLLTPHFIWRQGDFAACRSCCHGLRRISTILVLCHQRPDEACAPLNHAANSPKCSDDGQLDVHHYHKSYHPRRRVESAEFAARVGPRFTAHPLPPAARGFNCLDSRRRPPILLVPIGDI